jgi:hypothetical protein
MSLAEQESSGRRGRATAKARVQSQAELNVALVKFQTTFGGHVALLSAEYQLDVLENLALIVPHKIERDSE